MKRVKLSTLSKNEIVMIGGYTNVIRVEDILEDIESYRDEEVYTTTPRHATFNAKSIIDDAIENEYQDMYEDWDESIGDDVTEEDIVEIQAILDRILARNPEQNIAYFEDKLVEFDI